MLARRFDLPPMQKIETAWRPPWIICTMAQQGLRHFRAGTPSDDNHAVGGAAGVTWLVVSDGVGSAPRSRIGSRLACHAVDQFLGAKFDAGAAPTRGLLLEAMASAHETLTQHARSERQTPDTYACTLCVAVLHDDCIIASSVGDSSIAISATHVGFEGETIDLYAPFCTPPQGRESGSTFSITGAAWREWTACNQTRNPAVTALYVASDGGHNFFLDPAGDDEHGFDPAYPTWMRDRLKPLGPLLIGNIFGQFMADVAAENHDDRTLLVALRAPADLIPAPPT